MSLRPTTAHNVSSDDLIQSVIETVANAENAEPTDLDPLNNVIDTNTLNALCEDEGSPVCSIVFRYHGDTVTVSRDGQVTLE